MGSANAIGGKWRAFSLVEMLVVMAILALLVALLIPSYSHVIRTGDRAKCASNLRQIGIAIQGYAGDHDGWLPGPTAAAQVASYTLHQITTAPNHLVAFLFPYLDLPRPPPNGRAEVFECPAQKKMKQNESEATFYIHRTTVFEDGSQQRPFGHKASGGVVKIPNMKIQNVLRPAQTVSLLDTSGPPALPEVHGTTRNILFLDGHVETIELNRFTLDAGDIVIH